TVLGALRNVSGWNPHPPAMVDASFHPAGAAVTGIDTQLSVGPLTGAKAFYSPSGITPGQKYRFTSDLDASSLPTGHYDVSIQIVAHLDSGEDITRTYQSETNIRNLRDSAFGNRWSMLGLDSIVVNNQGVLLVEGSGNMYFFPAQENNTWGPARGDHQFITV